MLTENAKEPKAQGRTVQNMLQMRLGYVLNESPVLDPALLTPLFFV